jgi:hypothetical protein
MSGMFHIAGGYVEESSQVCFLPFYLLGKLCLKQLKGIFGVGGKGSISPFMRWLPLFIGRSAPALSRRTSKNR